MNTVPLFCRNKLSIRQEGRRVRVDTKAPVTLCRSQSAAVRVEFANHRTVPEAIEALFLQCRKNHQGKSVWSFDSLIKLIERSHILLLRKAMVQHILDQLFENLVSKKHAGISNF